MKPIRRRTIRAWRGASAAPDNTAAVSRARLRHCALNSAHCLRASHQRS
ncbi:Uncharacterised protein [Bordetella pertussis]|nr:Uncharacterised protein [Bordetella pertussis]